MNFTFNTETTKFALPSAHDPLYHLENQVERLNELSPTKQLAILYNDAKNYMMGSMSPTSEWYTKRQHIIQGYASLDWLALGEHLNPKSSMLGNLCTTIHRQLQELASQPSFNLAIFCSMLSKIDHLWHIILPSHLEGIQNPAVVALLEHCGQVNK
jgi:hypothetical protein